MKLFTIVKEQSERIPSKNFQEVIQGKELWKWTIERLANNQFETYVNTDSPDVLSDIRDLPNVYGIPRAQHHIDWEMQSQTRGSPVEDMLISFASNSTIPENEIICLFHVTSPFITLGTIKHASSYLEKGFDSVQSVKKIQDFVFLQNDDASIVPVNYDPAIVQRTQDLRPVYMSLGAFFISTKRLILKEKTRLPGKTYNYELNQIESVEIDYPSDLELTRCIVNGRVS